MANLRPVSGKPVPYLTFDNDGELTGSSKKSIAAAWSEFIATTPEAKKLERDPDDDHTADRNHRRVWQYLVPENGVSRSVTEAYELYHADYSKASMSKSTFTAYAETPPEGTGNWVYTLGQPYMDSDIQSYREWSGAPKSTGQSEWADSMGDRVSELTDAEQRAVQAFYAGEEIWSHVHPLCSSFKRAKAKLKTQLEDSGYLKNRA